MKRAIWAALLTAMGISLAATAAETPGAGYVPGMGEFMGATQMRHAKLWFAGQAANWDLASYELDEIREGLDDAVAHVPVYKNQVPVAALLDKFMAQPLSQIESAVKARDGAKFRNAYDRLTQGCNACHQAAGRGFIVIKRPEKQPYSNQEFAAKAK